MVDTFDEELCETFVAATISFAKINNSKLKHFLEKYTHKHIPHDAQNIECKDTIIKPNIAYDFSLIDQKSQNLSKTIAYLQSEILKLYDALAKLQSTVTQLKNLSGEFGKQLKRKVESVVTRNPDLNLLNEFCGGITEPHIRTKYETSIFSV